MWCISYYADLYNATSLIIMSSITLRKVTGIHVVFPCATVEIFSVCNLSHIGRFIF